MTKVKRQMALYSRVEFGALTGVKPGDLFNYIKRGKVVLTGDVVDSSNQVNAIFIERRNERRSGEDKKIIKKVVVEPKEETSAPVAETNSKEKKSPTNRNELSLVALEREKKLADLIKVETDTRLAQLKEEKLLGQSIPTDLVRTLVLQLNKSFISNFKDGVDNFLIQISKRKGLSIVETAELKGDLIKIINLSSTKSISECKKTLKQIVSEYSVSKGVGEHE